MKDGKLSEVAFKRSVLPVVKRINDHGEKFSCMRTAVVTGNEEGVAYLAVVRAMNALAELPAAVESVAISISVPDGFVEGIARFEKGASPDISENAVKALMGEIDRALSGKNVTISDITVEVTKNTLITVSVTACGKASPIRMPGRNNLVMVGYTGAAGSAMLSQSHKEALTGRYTNDFISASDKLLDSADVSDKILNIYQTENYKTVVKNVSDGGVFGAIWSLCDLMDCGCEIDIKSIPIKQVTVEVSEFFDINPYILRGDGAFLYVTDKTQEEISDGVVIGRLTKGSDRVVINGEIRTFLTPVKEDSYFDIR